MLTCSTRRRTSVAPILLSKINSEAQMMKLLVRGALLLRAAVRRPHPTHSMSFGTSIYATDLIFRTSLLLKKISEVVMALKSRGAAVAMDEVEVEVASPEEEPPGSAEQPRLTDAQLADAKIDLIGCNLGHEASKKSAQVKSKSWREALSLLQSAAKFTNIYERSSSDAARQEKPSESGGHVQSLNSTVIAAFKECDTVTSIAAGDPAKTDPLPRFPVIYRPGTAVRVLFNDDWYDC